MTAVLMGLLFAPAGIAAAGTAASASNAAPASSNMMAVPVHPTTYISPVVKGAAQVPLVGQFVLRMRSDASLFVKNEGIGVDAKVVATNYSTWSIVSNCGGSSVSNLQNQSGGYLRAKTAGDVQDSNTCDGNAEWTPNNDGTGVQWTNVGVGGKLSVATDVSGSGVKVGASWLIDSFPS
jgi:hypothetical protein